MSTFAITEGLSVDSLVIDYGGGAVVRGISLDVSPGEFVALIGPNGAGKTSTLNAIAGLVLPTAGRARIGDQDVTGWRPERVARAGVLLVPEHRGLFPQLTVDEHLRLAAHGRVERNVSEEIFGRFPNLAARRRLPVAMLSGGEAQMLAVALALVVQPKVMLIDELSFGLGPRVVRELLGECRRLADEQGMAILVVEQFVELVLHFADRGVVLTRGEVAFEDSAARLRNRLGEIRAAYLGFGGTYDLAE